MGFNEQPDESSRNFAPNAWYEEGRGNEVDSLLWFRAKHPENRQNSISEPELLDIERMKTGRMFTCEFDGRNMASQHGILEESQSRIVSCTPAHESADPLQPVLDSQTGTAVESEVTSFRDLRFSVNPRDARTDGWTAVTCFDSRHESSSQVSAGSLTRNPEVTSTKPLVQKRKSSTSNGVSKKRESVDRQARQIEVLLEE